MSTSDAILIGEDWISEHYFSTDARSQSFLAKVLDLRKIWDDESVSSSSVRERFTQARAELEATLAALTDQSEPSTLTDAYAGLSKILGYVGGGLVSVRSGPVTRLSTAGMDDGPLAVVEAVAVDSLEALLEKDSPTLLEPYLLDDKDEISSVARLLSTLFVSEGGPKFALVLAGRWLLVAEQERWAEGRYLAVDLLLVCERNDGKRGGEIDRALACVGAESLAPDADGDIWWTGVLEESRKHTVGVSQDLREGVRLSIEILANDVVRRRQAQGLTVLPKDLAQPLAMQALRFLYRILFLLYAESSPELGVLPIGIPEYEKGYSLDRLRDLTLVDLATPSGREGRHLYDSLAVLFRLVDEGHEPLESPASEEDLTLDGLTFRSLRADLFHPKAIALIHEVGLGNEALQQVLRHLLLSKESRGRDRGFISYAELGINQLGAVYEGLMSYTGFFAEEDLYEVAKGGDASKGSWVVPVDRAAGISSADFVYETDQATGESRPVLHATGTFVYRLAGRERQQSASYYTPEVLTRFTVGQALEELLDQDGETTPARDVLDLTVCEPALGSGAFAIEAVRQLAEQYLRRRQQELGERIDPDEYPRRLQEVKAYLALHQVYGVDLNATAVELAEISLWLDTMVSGLKAPWFGLHLRRGNSLIGARRAVFRRSQITDRSWLKDVPDDVPLAALLEGFESGVGGRVHHFLLPAEGWGSAVDAREAKELAPEALARLKDWRRSALTKPTKPQTDALVDLGHRVEQLWQIALSRLQIAEQEIRRSVPVWGAQDLPVGGAVQRHEIEAALADPSGAYGRLKRIMDAWCALWFWPLTDTLTTQVVDGQRVTVKPPALADWIDALHMLLGRHDGKKRIAPTQERLGSGTTWAELNDLESFDLGFASALPVESTLAKHPWLRVCERIAEQQGFFHWELTFAPVFARGGFDLQLGNPPWVRPRSDVDALLAEGDPWWQLDLKPSETQRNAKRPQTLALPGITALVMEGTSDVVATAAYVGSVQQYPHLEGLQPDLYRCFMEQTWRHASPRGTVGLIHPEKHFTDEKAGPLRQGTYRRLRQHWHFVNELILFAEIEHHKHYGVHIYGHDREVAFSQASWLYHPETIARSQVHDGSGDEPGLKDPDGKWDVRPHRGRLVQVNNDTLATWHAVLEDPQTPILQTRMVYAVNRATAAVLDKLSKAPRIGSLELEFSRGFDESIDRKKGYFKSSWGVPATWDDVILQGPHLFVATPMYKSPNKTMLNNQDWSTTDFEALASDAIPTTAYKPAGDRAAYDAKYSHWGTQGEIPARDHYRVAWRRMAANTGERTLIPAIIPPGAAHVDGIYSAAMLHREPALFACLAGLSGALISDFFVRIAPKGDIRSDAFARLPWMATAESLSPELELRALRLSCVVRAYENLWLDCWREEYGKDQWAGGFHHSRRSTVGAVADTWTSETPLRIATDRRQALLEIDALVALMLSVTADELCTIYRTQFPVLYGYDRKRDHYDANGRLVPNSVLTVWRKRGERITLEERTATNQAGNTYTYELPFVTLDREADMRVAYAEFERRLKERS